MAEVMQIYTQLYNTHIQTILFNIGKWNKILENVSVLNDVVGGCRCLMANI